MDGMPLEDGGGGVFALDNWQIARGSVNEPGGRACAREISKNAPTFYRLIPTSLSGGEIDVRLFENSREKLLS